MDKDARSGTCAEAIFSCLGFLLLLLPNVNYSDDTHMFAPPYAKDTARLRIIKQKPGCLRTFTFNYTE